MKTYVAFVDDEAVLAFRADNDDEAHGKIDDNEGSIRSDLNALRGVNKMPLLQGKAAFKMRQATAAQHAQWKKSRDQGISVEEIDSGHNADDWYVYLGRVGRTK